MNAALNQSDSAVVEGPGGVGCAMDQLPDPAAMTDQALLAEWNCTTCDVAIEDARTSGLAAEMTKRQIDF